MLPILKIYFQSLALFFGTSSSAAVSCNLPTTMESIIPNILSFILPYLTKIGETFYSETIKEAAKDSWKKLKSYFKNEESEKIVTQIENGTDDEETLSEFKKLFEEKFLNDNSFKEIILKITTDYNNEIIEVLKRPTYKFDNLGNVVIGNPVYTTNNSTTVTNVTNIIVRDEEEFYSLINKNIVHLEGISNQLKENVESKLLNVKYLINVKDYIKANEVCDEIRNLYAQVPEVWEYKAICEYFIDTQKNETIKNSARNVTACLNMAKERRNFILNNTHIEISQEIANRYFKVLINRISKIIQTSLKTYKEQIKLFKLIAELKTCFEIHNDNRFLYVYIDLLSGLKGFTWLSFAGTNPQSKYFSLTNDVKINDNSPTSEIIQVLLSKAKGKILKNNDTKFKLPEVIFFHETFNQSFTYNELLDFKSKRKDEINSKIEILFSEKISLEKSKNLIDKELSYKDTFINQIFNSSTITNLKNSSYSLYLKISDVNSKINKEKELLTLYT